MFATVNGELLIVLLLAISDDTLMVHMFFDIILMILFTHECVLISNKLFVWIVVSCMVTMWLNTNKYFAVWEQKIQIEWIWTWSNNLNIVQISIKTYSTSKMEWWNDGMPAACLANIEANLQTYGGNGRNVSKYKYVVPMSGSNASNMLVMVIIIITIMEYNELMVEKWQLLVLYATARYWTRMIRTIWFGKFVVLNLLKIFEFSSKMLNYYFVYIENYNRPESVGRKRQPHKT